MGHTQNQKKAMIFGILLLFPILVSAQEITPTEMDIICSKIYQFSLGNFVNYTVSYSDETFSQFQTEVYYMIGKPVPEQMLRSWIDNGQSVCNFTLPQRPIASNNNVTTQQQTFQPQSQSWWDYHFPIPNINMGQVNRPEKNEVSWISFMNLVFMLEYSDQSKTPSVYIKGVRWSFIIGLIVLIFLIHLMRKRAMENEESKEKRKKLIFKLMQG